MQLCLSTKANVSWEYLSLTYARNFCLIIELSIVGILNYWARIAATRGKPTTIIEQKFQALKCTRIGKLVNEFKIDAKNAYNTIIYVDT